MKKKIGKLTVMIAAAAIASSALAAGASAFGFCIGGRCFGITLPGSGSGCALDIFRIANGTYNVSTGQNCNSGNCTNGSTCTGGNCTNNTDTVAQTNTADSDVSEVFALVNKVRSENGLSALTLDTKLCKAAEVRAKEIVKTFSHTRPNGTSCFTVLGEEGITYRYSGENLAYGQKSASAVMNAWLNSSGHRANILGRNFGKAGIACYKLNGVKYWVQLFTD